jgi:uncharacterized protein YndB with AHSA1/START domain
MARSGACLLGRAAWLVQGPRGEDPEGTAGLTASVVRTVEVAIDPEEAFEVFTQEIGAWYRGGSHSWTDPSRAVGIRFEPGVGGRWIEVWDATSGEGFELGRIRVWEPGERLVVTYRAFDIPPDVRTEIEVRFEPIGTGTRVTLEHRGLDQLPPAQARTWMSRAWIQFIGWYRQHVQDRAGAACEDENPSRHAAE